MFQEFEKDESCKEAMDGLIEAVEPIAGFRPENSAQAISLLVSEFKKMEPAMTALQDLMVALDGVGDNS